MGLHLSGHRQYELLLVETKEFVFTIKGRPIHPTVDALNLHRTNAGQWVKAELIISCNDDFEAWVFDPYEEGESRLYVPGDRYFPCFYENQTYEVIIEDKTEGGLQFFHENKYIREAVTYVGRSKVMTGNINFRNDIGLSQLEIWANSKRLLTVTIEVFPAKIEYRSDYFQLLTEVTAELYNLAFDFLQRTYLSTQLSPSTKPSLTEFFSIIRYCFERLYQALKRIENCPHHVVSNERRFTYAENVRRVDGGSLKWLVKKQSFLQRSRRGIKIGDGTYLPTKILEIWKRIDFDTFENRFVKWIITSIQNKLRHFQRVYRKTFADSSVFDERIIEMTDSMWNRLYKMKRFSFLVDVGDLHRIDNLSLVLQMAPGYREVYKYYLMLVKGLSLQSDIFHISIKDLAQLYEYWCFLKLHSILRDRYQLEKHDLIRVNNTGLTVRLDKSRRASIYYTNPQNNEKIVLSYNNLLNAKMPTTSQRPDSMLTLKKEDGDVEYQYVFDAKYRLNPALPGSEYYSKYRKPGPEEDDINTMHRYRDAILYSRGEEIAKTVFGAYILFPYKDSSYYAGITDGQPHTFYSSIEKVNIGGLPFLPGETGLVESFLDELIIESPDSAFERAVPQAGSKLYYKQKFRPRTVLVGVVRDERQLRVNLDNHFYHIPYQRVKRTCFHVDYIALYQPETVFGDDSGIRYYGLVDKMEVVKRKDITELPKNSKELYVKFTVSDWKNLVQPIKAAGYGVRTHLYTTLYLLQKAQELPELSLRSEGELRLWKELRRLGKRIKWRAQNRQLTIGSKVNEIKFNNVTISVLEDRLIISNGQQNEDMSLTDLSSKPRAVLKTILRLAAVSHPPAGSITRGQC